MIGAIVSQCLRLVVVVYVARRFSSAQFGSFSFAMAVNAYVFVVAHFGLPLYGARAVAKAGRVSLRLVQAITCARASLSVFGLAIALGSLSLFPQVTKEELLVVTTFGLSNLALAGLYDWAFQGLGRLDISALLNTLWQGTWLILTMASVHEVWGISGVGFALSVSALIASALSYVWLKRSVWLENEGEYQQSLIRESWEIVKSGAHLGVGTMLITVLTWTDTIVVRLLRGDHAVGVYAAGNRAALALSTLAGFYVLGALPYLSQASTAEPSRFVSLFQRTYDDLALLFLPGALWTISYAPEVIQLLFKQGDYIAGVSVFRIFQVVLVVNAISTLYGLGGLVAHHRDRTYQRVLLISTAAFVVLCPLLTIAWGIEGGALAVLATQILCMVLFFFEARGLAPARHGRALLPPLALGAGAVFACRSLGLSLLPGVGMLILAYAILLVLRARSIRQEGIWRAVLQQG